MNSSSARQNEHPAGGLTASATDRLVKRLPQAIAAFLLASGFLHAAEPVVEHVVTGQPSFTRRGAAVHVLLVDSTNRLEAIWYNSDFFRRRFSLDTNQVYTFSVLQGLDAPPPGPRITRVHQGTERLYDAGFCDVHQRRMELRPQPITYGLSGPPGQPSPAEAQAFPHRRRIISGGCIIVPDQPQDRLKFECDECNAAFERWRAQQGKVDPEQLRRSRDSIQTHLDELADLLKRSTALTWSREARAARAILESVRTEADALEGQSRGVGPLDSGIRDLDKLLRRAGSDIWSDDVPIAREIVGNMKTRLWTQ